jgi:hypothetical protein
MPTSKRIVANRDDSKYDESSHGNLDAMTQAVMNPEEQFMPEVYSSLELSETFPKGKTL